MTSALRERLRTPARDLAWLTATVVIAAALAGCATSEPPTDGLGRVELTFDEEMACDDAVVRACAPEQGTFAIASEDQEIRFDAGAGSELVFELPPGVYQLRTVDAEGFCISAGEFAVAADSITRSDVGWPVDCAAGGV